MKISTAKLKKLIKEELFYREFYRGGAINEVGPPPDMDAPGWHPNDSQEWEREADAERRQEYGAEKKAFLEKEQARWEDEMAVETDEEAEVVSRVLSDAYNKIYEEIIGPV